jgi:hypothetical protein
VSCSGESAEVDTRRVVCSLACGRGESAEVDGRSFVCWLPPGRGESAEALPDVFLANLLLRGYSKLGRAVRDGRPQAPNTLLHRVGGQQLL